VGADVVETNTFGAFGVPLGEYDIADRSPRDRQGQRPHRPGGGRRLLHPGPQALRRRLARPGTKFPSLGQIRFAELRDHYQVAAEGLLEGGVDLFILETHFDLLAVKASVIGARRAMAKVGRQVPIQCQVTMELTGRMLVGTEIAPPSPPSTRCSVDIIGLNCATGPTEMGEHMRHLSPARPHADLGAAQRRPAVGGRRQDALRPHPRAAGDHQRRFVEELGVQVIGGCCGTTPEYIRCSPTWRPTSRPPPAPGHEPSVASIYSPVALRAGHCRS
jgi:5-methyltetrahydrofolate--homocysteine methyltransferase